jgi:hypothetical protein
MFASAQAISKIAMTGVQVRVAIPRDSTLSLWAHSQVLAIVDSVPGALRITPCKLSREVAARILLHRRAVTK